MKTLSENNIHKNILVCDGVNFYSLDDEDIFFEWILKLNCIETFSARHKMLYLHIPTGDLQDADLQELIALFDRYNINMKQLSNFMTSKNKAWFYNKKSFWYKKVFDNNNS